MTTQPTDRDEALRAAKWVIENLLCDTSPSALRERERVIQMLNAALLTQRDDAVMVPRVPTPEMRAAYNTVCQKSRDLNKAWLVNDAYAAMIAAAPKEQK